MKVCLSWPWSLPSNWGCTTGLCLCHISMMHLQQQLHPVLYHCDSVTVHFSTYSSPLGSTWQHASESVPITGSKAYCNTRFLSKYNTIGFICVFSNFSLNRKEKRVEQDFFFSPEKCKYNRRMPVSISTACTRTRAGPPLQAGTPASIWEWPTWGCLGQCGRDAVLSDHLPCCSNLVPHYCFFTLSGRIYMMPFPKPFLYGCTRISVQKEARPHEKSNCISSLWNQSKVTAFQWERQPEGQQKNHKTKPKHVEKGKLPKKILGHRKKTSLTVQSSFPLTTPNTRPGGTVLPSP